MGPLNHRFLIFSVFFPYDEDVREVRDMARCVGFEMENVKDAFEHFYGKWDWIESYGDSAYGHYLHTWDDGERALLRCRKCGGLIRFGISSGWPKN